MHSYRVRIVALLCLAVLVAVGGCRKQKKVEAGSAREIDPGGGLPILLIDVPADYRVNPRKGADFDVYYFQRERTEKGDHPPLDGMGIYIGHNPDFSPPKDARSAEGMLAGRKVTWFEWEDDSGERTIMRMQTVVPDLFAGAKEKAGGNAGLQVHVFLWAPGERRLGILFDAAKTLRLKP